MILLCLPSDITEHRNNRINIMPHKRIEEIDILKGIGAFVMMTVHMVYVPHNGLADMMIIAVAWHFISLYFMLSGCTLDTAKRSVPRQYVNRLRYLLLPAVITEAVIFAAGGVYCMFFHGYTPTDLIHDVTVMVLRPEICEQLFPEWGNGGLLYDLMSPSWFIWSLILTDIVFYPIARWCDDGRNNKRWWVAVVVCSVVQIPFYLSDYRLPWVAEVVPIFIVFCLIGTKIRTMGILEKEWKFSPPVTFLIAAVCFAAHFGLYCFGGDGNFYSGHFGTRGWIDIINVIAQLLVGSVGWYAVSKLIIRIRPVSAFLIWVGRRTVVFLLWHRVFGMVMSDILHTYIRSDQVSTGILMKRA